MAGAGPADSGCVRRLSVQKQAYRKGEYGLELPGDFKERIKCQLGDAYEDFLAVYEKERVCGLRVNPLKIEKEALRAALLKHGIMLEDTPWAEEGFYYPPDTQPGKLALHEAGAYYIQEPSAMLPAVLLDPQPGECILDLCAAPGGKSTQIAGRMQGMGLLISNETVSQRARILSRNIERMGIANAVVLNETPERLAGRFAQFFDRILADAPCSGEGMFRKDENARGEWSLNQVQACAKRQREILTQAVRMLKPGGVLVYSTCTFAPQENEEMAQWLVQQFPEFTLEQQEHLWPHKNRGEGHYAARFRKAGGQQAGTAGAADWPAWTAKQASHMAGTVSGTGRKAGLQASGTGRKAGLQVPGRKLLEQFCRESLSAQGAQRIFERMEQGQLASFGGQLYLVPPQAGSLYGLRTERAGLHLGCLKKNRFEPSHALAMALRPQDGAQVLELEEPERYIRGETVSCEGHGYQGWTLAAAEGCTLGWGKASQGVLKNHYPKGLRRNG